MNLFILVWSYLKARPLTTVLNIFLLALGIAVITVLILFSSQFQEKVNENTKGIDLVVGAKGSPLQLILCSIFHIDFPTGNIKIADAEKVARHRLVKGVIPLALGDSYEGYRIIGTTSAYAELYRLQLTEGRWWSGDLEVTLGANVAERLQMNAGSTFVSAHGLTKEGHAHEESTFLVVGVMKKSGNVSDNLIFTNIESIWHVHEVESDTLTPKSPSPVVASIEAGDSIREVTSLLVQYRNPLAVIQMPRYINGIGNLQAASPAFETARLFSILGVGADVLRAFAFVLILISGLSIFIVMYNSMKERRYDLAIMRSMGAGRSTLFLFIVTEGSALTLMGSIMGLVLGHVVLMLFTVIVPQGADAGLQATRFYLEEAWLLGGSLLLGILCSLLPGIQAYRTDIHKVLAG